MKKLIAKIRAILRNRRVRKIWMRTISSIACLVVFITTYALVLPAITMESEAACGIEAHQHDDSCYEERLICNIPESDGHIHTEDCYSTTQKLICNLSEHLHTSDCYDEEGNLTCSQEEHQHGKDCYEEIRELICGLEESEGHHHDSSCYEKVLTCEKEVHTHSPACYREDAASVAATEHAAIATTTTTSADDAAMDETANASGTFDPAETAAEGYVPTLDELDFRQLLNDYTTIYYHRPEDSTEDSGQITDWQKVTEDTVLGETDILRVYLAYAIPAGSLNETNATARYRLPGNLHLTDEQMEAINQMENGLSGLYVDYDTLQITDAEKHSAYLGAEAVDGLRMPDQTIEDYLSDNNDTDDGEQTAQEIISAVVKTDQVYDVDGVYGEKGAYLGTDLVFTFSPYTILKNRNEYDSEGTPVKAGESVSGWFTLDFNMDQIDWGDNAAEITFVSDDNDLDTGLVSVTLKKADPISEETDPSSEETPDSSNSDDEKTFDDNSSTEENKAETVEETHPAVNFEDSLTVHTGNLSSDTDAGNLPNSSKMTVSVSAEAGTFPVGTTMVLSAVTDLDAVAEAVEGTVDSKTCGFQAVDISFRDKDGNEIEPLKPISVTMRSDSIKAATEDSSMAPVVVHVENQSKKPIDAASDLVTTVMETLPSSVDTNDNSESHGITDSSESISFKADSFSIYAIVYTVDFHYESNGKVYDFSIPGGGFVSLEHVVEVLGIASNDENTENGAENAENGTENGNAFVSEVPDADVSGENGTAYEEAIKLNEIEVSEITKKFMAAVESVEFSSPELVWVGKVDETSTVGELKEANGLEVKYSAELTEEQIAEINAQTIEAGDRALISMQPFTSEETLTVTMKNGDVWTVKVTDAYDETNHPLKLHFVNESGQPISEITFDGETIQTNNGVFTLTSNWVRNHVESNGTESVLDLTKFVTSGFTLSNTHKSTYADSYGSYTSSWNHDGKYPHTIIGNELLWTNEGDLQYRLFYMNSDKAGSRPINVGYEPYRNDNYWKYRDDVTPVGDPPVRNYTATESDDDPYPYDYYLVYSPEPGSGSVPGGNNQNLTPEQLDPIGRSKTLTPNQDGTYTMDLSVTTETLPHEENKGVNVIVLFDTSSSMRRKVGDDTVQYTASEFKDKDDSRFIQAKNALAKILNEVCPSNNATTKELELALVDFNYEADDHKFSNNTYWTTSPTEFINTVGGLDCPSGTNWADALKMAKTIKATADDDPTYVVLMTDGAPSQYWSVSNYFVSGECGYLGARDESRAVVNDGMELFSVFSYGTQKDKDNQYLTKLVDYAYNKTTNGHAFYADGTEDLEASLRSIFGILSEKIGHTNVNYYDGIALDTTSTALKINAGGSLGSITYSKVGGTSPNYTVSTNADGTIKSFTVGGAPDSATGKWTGGSPYTNGSTTNITYKKISGGTPAEGEETSPISTADVTSPVYQCVVESGENAGTYNMPIATLAHRDTNEDGKADVGDLNWDLSPLGMLEDGATYKISFVVWPDQEAYDYVADLNNGKKQWNTETQTAWPEGATEEAVQYYKNGVPQYPNIVYNPTTKLYEVLTNTSQEVTYYIEDQISGTSEEESYSGIYTVKPEQPNPMPLTATQSEIEKAWGVDRNPSTLAQLLYDKDGNSKHFTIDYAIMRSDSDDPYMTMTLGWDDKQNKYIWEADSVRYVNYNGHNVPVGTRWSEDFAITTGLMLSEAQMDARGLDKNAYTHYSYGSTNYYILEPGYDYTIKEIFPEYAESWLTYEFDFISPVYHPMLVDGKLKSVTFTEQHGMITGISDISRDEWLASLKIENTLRGYINLEKIVLDRNGTTVRKNDDTRFTYHISMENYYTDPGPFRGDSIPWYGVNGLYYHDADFNYYQAETHTDNNKAYSFELTAEDGTVYQAHCTDPEGIFDEDIPGPTSVTYTIGEGEDAQEITILLYGNEMHMTDANNVWADLKISQKEKLSIANVPAGTKYTISEAQQDGYDVMNITREVRKTDGNGTLEDSSSSTGRDTITDVIVPDRENDIIFKNRVRSIDVSFDKVDGNGKALPGATFTLYSDETCETVAKDKLGEDLVAISKYNGKVCFGEMDAGTYYMKETETLEGYVLDETVYTVTVTQEGQTKHASITTPEGGEITEIVNPKEEITLSVEKTWLDADGNEILNTDDYSATFTAHRKMTYTTTEMQGEEPDGYSTLRIGYYYNGWVSDPHSIWNEWTNPYGAGQKVNISYTYDNNYNQKKYKINEKGSDNPLTENSGTVTVTMPPAGGMIDVYFYDQPSWGNGHITINSVDPVASQIETEVPHENEEDESFHPTLTLTGGNTSGTFEGTFPVEETIDGVTYY